MPAYGFEDEDDDDYRYNLRRRRRQDHPLSQENRGDDATSSTLYKDNYSILKNRRDKKLAQKHDPQFNSKNINERNTSNIFQNRNFNRSTKIPLGSHPEDDELQKLRDALTSDQIQNNLRSIQWQSSNDQNKPGGTDHSHIRNTFLHNISILAKSKQINSYIIKQARKIKPARGHIRRSSESKKVGVPIPSFPTGSDNANVKEPSDEEIAKFSREISEYLDWINAHLERQITTGVSDKDSPSLRKSRAPHQVVEVGTTGKTDSGGLGKKNRSFISISQTSATRLHTKRKVSGRRRVVPIPSNSSTAMIEFADYKEKMEKRITDPIQKLRDQVPYYQIDAQITDNDVPSFDVQLKSSINRISKDIELLLKEYKRRNSSNKALKSQKDLLEQKRGSTQNIYPTDKPNETLSNQLLKSTKSGKLKNSKSSAKSKTAKDPEIPRAQKSQRKKSSGTKEIPVSIFREMVSRSQLQNQHLCGSQQNTTPYTFYKIRDLQELYQEKVKKQSVAFDQQHQQQLLPNKLQHTSIDQNSRDLLTISNPTLSRLELRVQALLHIEHYTLGLPTSPVSPIPSPVSEEGHDYVSVALQDIEESRGFSQPSKKTGNAFEGNFGSQTAVLQSRFNQVRSKILTRNQHSQKFYNYHQYYHYYHYNKYNFGKTASIPIPKRSPLQPKHLISEFATPSPGNKTTERGGKSTEPNIFSDSKSSKFSKSSKSPKSSKLSKSNSSNSFNSSNSSKRSRGYRNSKSHSNSMAKVSNHNKTNKYEIKRNKSSISFKGRVRKANDRGTGWVTVPMKVASKYKIQAQTFYKIQLKLPDQREEITSFYRKVRERKGQIGFSIPAKIMRDNNLLAETIRVHIDLEKNKDVDTKPGKNEVVGSSGYSNTQASRTAVQTIYDIHSPPNQRQMADRRGELQEIIKFNRWEGLETKEGVYFYRTNRVWSQILLKNGFSRNTYNNLPRNWSEIINEDNLFNKKFIINYAEKNTKNKLTKQTILEASVKLREEYEHPRNLKAEFYKFYVNDLLEDVHDYFIYEHEFIRELKLTMATVLNKLRLHYLPGELIDVHLKRLLGIIGELEGYIVNIDKIIEKIYIKTPYKLELGPQNRIQKIHSLLIQHSSLSPFVNGFDLFIGIPMYKLYNYDSHQDFLKAKEKRKIPSQTNNVFLRFMEAKMRSTNHRHYGYWSKYGLKLKGRDYVKKYSTISYRLEDLQKFGVSSKDVILIAEAIYDKLKSNIEFVPMTHHLYKYNTLRLILEFNVKDQQIPIIKNIGYDDFLETEKVITRSIPKSKQDAFLLNDIIQSTEITLNNQKKSEQDIEFFTFGLIIPLYVSREGDNLFILSENKELRKRVILQIAIVPHDLKSQLRIKNYYSFSIPELQKHGNIIKSIINYGIFENSEPRFEDQRISKIPFGTYYTFVLDFETKEKLPLILGNQKNDAINNMLKILFSGTSFDQRIASPLNIFYLNTFTNRQKTDGNYLKDEYSIYTRQEKLPIKGLKDDNPWIFQPLFLKFMVKLHAYLDENNITSVIIPRSQMEITETLGESPNLDYLVKKGSIRNETKFQLRKNGILHLKDINHDNFEKLMSIKSADGQKMKNLIKSTQNIFYKEMDQDQFMLYLQQMIQPNLSITERIQLTLNHKINKSIEFSMNKIEKILPLVNTKYKIRHRLDIFMKINNPHPDSVVLPNYVRYWPAKISSRKGFLVAKKSKHGKKIQYFHDVIMDENFEFIFQKFEKEGLKGWRKVRFHIDGKVNPDLFVKDQDIDYYLTSCPYKTIEDLWLNDASGLKELLKKSGKYLQPKASGSSLTALFLDTLHVKYLHRLDVNDLNVQRLKSLYSARGRFKNKFFLQEFLSLKEMIMNFNGYITLEKEKVELNALFTKLFVSSINSLKHSDDILDRSCYLMLYHLYNLTQQHPNKYNIDIMDHINELGSSERVGKFTPYLPYYDMFKNPLHKVTQQELLFQPDNQLKFNNIEQFLRKSFYRSTIAQSIVQSKVSGSSNSNKNDKGTGVMKILSLIQKNRISNFLDNITPDEIEEFVSMMQNQTSGNILEYKGRKLELSRNRKISDLENQIPELENFLNALLFGDDERVSFFNEFGNTLTIYELLIQLLREQ